MPPYRGVDFFGRVEVQYNNTWGTVCDDFVRLTEANVICQSLNFDRALCFLPRARYGPGSGTYEWDVLHNPRNFEHASEVNDAGVCHFSGSQVSAQIATVINNHTMLQQI